ncbi:MAG: phosphoadenosine phosphosulfate reductase family protein [Candidatus Micrarchaeaceae archaeon]
MDKEDEEFIKKNGLEGKFTAERTDKCLELMRPEVRSLVDLPLEKKIKKSQEIIKESLEKKHNVGIGFSGGSDSEVTLHLTLPLKHDIPIVFVDTRYEFPETLQFIEELRETWNFENFTIVRAEKDMVKEFTDQYGYKTPEFTIAFNNYHKIQPMLRAIANLRLDAFIAGIRGVEHEERAKESFFSERKNPDHIRVHPLLFWKKEDVLAYIKKFNLPTNPLYAKGYTSLGSTIDTTPNTDPNAHERAGRGIVRETVMKKLRELGYN